MVQTHQQPGPPPTFVFEGTIVPKPDMWGNHFSVSETLVELQTSDKNYISGKTPFQHGPMTITDTLTGAGFFRLLSHRHPTIVPLNSLSLQLTNIETQNLYKHPIQWQFIQKPTHVFNQQQYDLGSIEVPWPASAPKIASIDNTQFGYPADFALRLATSSGRFRWAGSIELLRSHQGSPDPSPDIEDLFFALERTSKGAPNNITSKLASELIPILNLNLSKIRGPMDVFQAALKHYSNMRFNVLSVPEFNSEQLIRKLRNACRQAFNTVKLLDFSGLKGCAAFCALLFTAGRVAEGQSITVTSNEIGANWVTNVFIT